MFDLRSALPRLALRFISSRRYSDRFAIDSLGFRSPFRNLMSVLEFSPEVVCEWWTECCETA